MGNKSDRRLFLGSVVLALGLVGAEAASWAGGVWQNAQQARAGLAETRQALTAAQAAPPEADRSGSLEVLQLGSACAAATRTSDSLNQLDGQVHLLKPLLGALDAVPSLGRQARTQAEALEAASQLGLAARALCQHVQPVAGLLQPGDGGGRDEAIGTALRALVQARPALLRAADSLEHAQRSVADLDAPVDADGARAIAAMRERTPALARSLRDASAMLGVLDGPGPRRFLLISQNPDEIRATGGFIGSAGVVEFRDGQLRLAEYGSSRAYDTPPSMRAVPPGPLQRYLGSTYWHLAGANWTPSFPDAARQIAYFYELSHPDQPLDGVIALDQVGLAELLRSVGPVAVPEYGETVSAEDVAAKLDQRIHVDDVGETRRKHFAAAVSKAVFGKLTGAPASTLPAVVRAIRGALDQQHLIVWVRDPEAARVLAQRRWTGSLLDFAGDYLMLVDSEVSFSKQSQEVVRDAEYAVDLGDGAAPTARLTLTYTNNSVKRNDWFRPVYRSYVRAYAPAGAQLVGSEGFRRPVTSHQECGRTVFGGEVAVATGAKARATLTYRLPTSVVTPAGYDLVLQQQPGLPPGQTVASLRWGAGEQSARAPSLGDRQAHVRWRLPGAAAQLEQAPLPEAGQSACGEVVQARSVAAPVGLTIPSIGVSAPIVPLGVGKDGQMESPDGPDDVGWYRTSARPGQPGNLVLSGHLDWRDRLAVFASLRQLEPGSTVVVRGEDGVEHSYAVEWNRSYPGATAPIDEIVSGSDDSLLTLITCDGAFDRATRTYLSRRVVRARLVA
jgi:sortase (surface protein transpeptidase)